MFKSLVVAPCAALFLLLTGRIAGVSGLLAAATRIAESGPPWRQAAAFVIGTNLLLRPLVHVMNTRLLASSDAETQYTVEIACKGADEAQMRSVLLNALSQAGLGLRRLDSEDIADTSKVTVTAQAVAAKRNDAALEQIVGRLSLDPTVTGVTWQIDRTIPES